MTKIVVFDPNLTAETKQQLQKLSAEPASFPAERCPSDQLVERTGNADIVLVGPWDKITAAYLDACPSIRYVCLCGTSTANIDLEELEKRGIAFTNVVDYGDEPAAEFVFLQLARLLHGVGEYQWKAQRHELMNKTVGIIGLGALGKAIAHLALAYKMDASYFSLHRKHDWEERELQYKELPDLIRTNDIIIVSSPTNKQVLGEQEFALMKPGTILVQASAGDVIDKATFLDWIAQDGNFAIFDKSAGEDNYQAYKGLPRVIFADVVAGYTHETLQRLYEKVVSNLKAHLA
jgi:phosphoglycerate dehydrogenase-like enzyme